MRLWRSSCSLWRSRRRSWPVIWKPPAAVSRSSRRPPGSWRPGARTWSGSRPSCSRTQARRLKVQTPVPRHLPKAAPFSLYRLVFLSGPTCSAHGCSAACREDRPAVLPLYSKDSDSMGWDPGSCCCLSCVWTSSVLHAKV